jgi:hypothetical protein
VKLADLGVTKTQPSRWQQRAVLPKEQQEKLIEGAKRLARSAVENDSTAKAALRAEREQKLAAKVTALPTAKFGVILADSEWRFEPYSRENRTRSRGRQPLSDQRTRRHCRARRGLDRRRRLRAVPVGHRTDAVAGSSRDEGLRR